MTLERRAVLTHTQVASVSCGENHTLYATRAGRTYGMGSNAWCQIGQREPWETGFAAYNVPEAVPALARKRVTEVVCGADFSFALTDAGELYSWGVGRWGQLGDGQGKHVKAKPMPVKRVPFGGESADKALGAKIVCGSEHCLALLTSGQLWAWVRTHKKKRELHKRAIHWRSILPLHIIISPG